MPEENVRPISSVIVPIEGSSQELLTQEYGIQLAAGLGVPLVGLHVATGPSDPPGDLFQYAKRLCKRRGVRFEAKIIHGTDVVREIAEEAMTNDIIVIGTRLLGTDYHLGSVSERLVREAPCPVQIVRLAGPARRPAATARSAARAAR